MQDRTERLLRRIGVGLLSIVVVLLILVEDVLLFAGLVLRKILPANFEEYLKSQSRTFMYRVVGAACLIYLVFHVAEYAAFWLGYYWISIIVLVLSKVYSVSVLGYLGRVYSDRLLAVGWIRKSWDWYLSSKEWLKSFELYKVAHTFTHRAKEKAKATIKKFRESVKGRSMFAAAWRMIRRNRRQ